MKLLRTKIWSWFDIGLLKWSCILLGTVAGAYYADFAIKYVWVFIFMAVVLAIRPAIRYFKD